MNSDSLILRQTENPPLTNRNDLLTGADFDGNLIKIYNDLLSLANTSGVIAYNEGVMYDDTTEQFATYGGRLYRWIGAEPGMAITPPNATYWAEIFPTDLAHRKNSDTILAEGTADEVSAAEIKAFIAGGLTTTTNLGITSHTTNTLTVTSSTGTDVTIPEATQTKAGLLIAEDKAKLASLSGINTGDQTLSSLGGEAVANKKTVLTGANNTTYPTTQAVVTALSQLESDIVDAATDDFNTLGKIESYLTSLIAGRDVFSGYGVYRDTLYTDVSPLMVIGGAARERLTNNAGSVDESQLPPDVPSFYDGGKITGRSGDGVSIDISFTLKPLTNTATRITVVPDIGGAVGEIEAYKKDITFSKGLEVVQFYHYSFNAFTGDTWETNGAEMYIESSHDVEIYNIRFLITRTHKAFIT